MIADTSFLVAFFLDEDEFHDKAVKELELLNTKIVISDRVLEETFTVLNYKKGINFVLNVIEMLERNNDIIIYKIGEKDWDSIFNLIKQLNKKISFVDYSVIYLSLKIGEKILCFDDEMNKIISKNI